MGQSKIYAYGGMSTIFGGNLDVASEKLETGWFRLDHFTFDAEYERRVVGSFNVLTGLSLFNAGYETTRRTFGSASDFKAMYVAVPLMVRWNVGNKNMLFVDIGLAPFYLLRAELKESIEQFGKLRIAEGNITRYSNRFYFGSKLQIIIPINRFVMGFYVLVPVAGQSSLKDLEGHWGLNAQQSTYLLTNGFSDFQIMGIKAGFRIK